MPLRFSLALALLAVAGPPALAQGPVPGTCELGRAQATLDVSDVFTGLLNTGMLFYSYEADYEYAVPKRAGRWTWDIGDLWVGGYVGGELRTAGGFYGATEYWPGPLDPATARPPDPDDCSAFDRIWVVSVRDVEQYEATGVATPDLADWPAALGAEVVDGDGVPGNYDLAAGDRPRIYGSQTAFWVMNDVGNVHAETDSAPIGLEVRVHAFAVASTEPALAQSTFYRYTLVNRNDLPLTEARFGFWAEVALGAYDNNTGVDTTRGLGLVYNGDAQDGTGAPPTWGATPPAVGLDFLGGGLAAYGYVTNSGQGSNHPTNALEVYRRMSGRWNDGTPVYAYGNGYGETGHPVTTLTFPGDPVTNSFWSARCPRQPCGDPVGGSRSMFVAATGAFTLGPGEARTFDVAALFGRGADYLDSVTRLRAASDLVQQAYDAGALFDTAVPAPLATPVLIAPQDGQRVYGDLPVTLSWEPVPGAEGYVVDVWAEGAYAFRRAYVTTEPAVAVPGCGVPNHAAACAWRVRADAPAAGAVGAPSETRTFIAHEYEAGLQDGNGSVVEVASPAGPPCPDPGDFGCVAYGGEGNTVYLDANRTGDYLVAAWSASGWPFWDANDGLLGGPTGAAVAAPDDYEVRFTAAGGYAVYNAFSADTLLRRVVQVPFEVWNTGTTPGDPSDDVRMIPVLRRNRRAGQTGPSPYLHVWTDRFTASMTGVPDGGTGLPGTDTLAVTEGLWALFPDRPGGYALFELAALAFGGAGAVYDRAADGDIQIDVNPATGEPCARQGYYIAFCARNDRLPEGSKGNTQLSLGFSRLVFADLGMDGTTPPTGTVVRLKMARYPPVASEPPAPATGPPVAVEAVWPNPTGGRAAIRFSTAAPGRVRVALYDVLGRAVAVLADGVRAAGAHEAALDAGQLAPGVYLLRIETPAGSAARTLTVAR